MDVIALIGRILLVPLFVAGGLSHLTQLQPSKAYARSRGVPKALADVLVPASGVGITIGAVLVLLGVVGDLGAFMLITFLAPTAFMLHNFWTDTDPQVKRNEQSHFLKDLALTGTMLVFLAVFASGNMALTLTDSLWQLVA